jgi:hypothetical protein
MTMLAFSLLHPFPEPINMYRNINESQIITPIVTPAPEPTSQKRHPFSRHAKPSNDQSWGPQTI